MTGLEKRLSCDILPSTEFLLVKLDQIDLRLRQLEEKQKLPESYFSADLRRHHQCRSLSSALHDISLKGTLMERLQLLETRIRQLSYELDKSNGICMAETTPERALCSTRAVGEPSRTTDIFGRDSGQSKAVVKDSKEALDAIEKRASAMCRNEKRRLERTRLYRRWFPVGC